MSDEHERCDGCYQRPAVLMPGWLTDGLCPDCLATYESGIREGLRRAALAAYFLAGHEWSKARDGFSPWHTGAWVASKSIALTAGSALDE